MIRRKKRADHCFSGINRLWLYEEGVLMMRSVDIAMELDHLEKCIQKVSSELGRLKKRFPEDVRLRVITHGHGYQYYYRKGSEKNGKYIKKNNRNLAAVLAQIEYDEILITKLQEAIERLRECKPLLACGVFGSALDQMPPGKKELIEQHYIADEEYIINWQRQDYEKLQFREGSPEFYTKRGSRVRSKSEVIIADALDDFEVPFLYEKPLRLKSATVHPDFTLLNIKSRKELYWEHFGMMDDREYRDNAFQKIREYESNGLYQAESVIWTFETGRYPMNTRDIRNMIRVLSQELGY